MKRILIVTGMTTILLCGGCATLDHTPEAHDPWERFNRSMHHFNEKLDQTVLKPVATGYKKITPDPVEASLHNFFSNLGEIKTILNGLLQLKLKQTASDTGRFLLNSTLGIAGFFDIAQHLGLEKHNEDFGQTMGYWNIGNGPYLVLPLFGPSGMRDGPGFLMDSQVNPIRKVEDDAARIGLYILNTLDTRAQLLETGNILDEAATDPYIFIREAYLQKRLHEINDGASKDNPTSPEEDAEIFSDE